MNKVFSYEEQPITFVSKDGCTMVNATEMAKRFGKKPSKWLELPSTKEFLQELKKVRKSDSLIITAEGRTGGTFMHEDVALEFARWLSPKFAIWCNDRIKELMRYGVSAATSETIENLLADPANAIKVLTALQQERQAKEQLQLECREMQSQIRQQHKEISILREQTSYLDSILSSTSLMSVSQIAQDYGMTAQELNRILKCRGIQFKRDGQWILYSRYKPFGYVHSTTIALANGKIRMLTKWTQAGRLFLYEFLKSINILPVVEWR